MKRLLWLTILVSFSLISHGQDLELVTPLSTSLEESSGLIFLEEKLITHTDSGGEAALYEIDTLTGNVIRTVIVNGVENTDWEDITYDDEYIYIGDFGNNNGTRTDLKVLRILRSDYLQVEDNEVDVEIISFSYSDQNNFSSSQFSTNYDAEAFISFGDSLYIFTKNWGNMTTTIYPLSKVPGVYSLVKTDSIDVEGLVTGASINPFSNEVMLSAYTIVSPFAVKLSGFSDGIFSSGLVETIDLSTPIEYSYQIEGITALEQDRYYLTSEAGLAGEAGLFNLELNSTGTKEARRDEFELFPNPTNGFITIRGKDIAEFTLYNTTGNLILKSSNLSVDLSHLACGLYLVELRDSDQSLINTEKLLIK